MSRKVFAVLGLVTGLVRVAPHDGGRCARPPMRRMRSPGPRLLRARLLPALLAVAVWCAPSDAGATRLREQVSLGNSHYAAGRYEEALRTYEAALRDHPDADAAELLHNLAAAHFKLGQIEEAREFWVRSAALRDPPFEARARYNLGNCNYREALRDAEAGDLSSALERLGRASEHYRDAIRLAPELIDARANLELAQQLLRELREQADASTQPSSERQPSDEPQTQPQDGEPQDSESSESSSDRSSSTTQPDADSSSDDPEPQTQPSQPQSGNEQEDESPQSQPEQPPDASSQTQPAETQPADTQPAAPQTAPADEPAEAGDENTPQTQPDSADGPPDVPQEPVNLQLTREEAERLLQMIRDAEMKRRQAALRQQRMQQRPVERDW